MFGSIVLIFGMLLAVALPTARAQDMLYDDFSGPDLDENKWTAVQDGVGALDTVRHLAACLVRDGTIIAAAQEERFSRKQHDAGFPKEAVRYGLRLRPRL